MEDLKPEEKGLLLSQAVAVAKIEARLEAVEKDISRLDGKPGKWDVAVQIFLINAAIAGIVTLVIAVIRWASGH